MKRHPVLADLSRDHHGALVTAQYIKKGAPTFRGMPASLEGKREYVLHFFKEHWEGHFLKEEEVLFPFVKKVKPELDLLVAELTAEHRSIEALVQKIESGFDIEMNLDELGNTMESHIRKEERILFQQMQEKLSADDFREIERQLFARKIN